MTTTTEDDQELDEFNEAFAELRLDRPDSTFEEERAIAGTFVANFGRLSDWFEEPHLTTVQFSYAQMAQSGSAGASALSQLGHWSVSRGDPRDEPPADYDYHRNGPDGCTICTYLEACLAIKVAFDDELCEHCQLDVDSHEITPDPAGEPFAWCLSTWQRAVPFVHEAADIGGDDQISDAWESRWWAPLTDGTFAVITRYYYVVERDGRRFLEEQTEYMWCRDHEHPGDTEINADGMYREVDPEGDTVDEGTDTKFFAEQAPYPSLTEWDEYAPASARGLLAPAQ